MLSPLRHSDSEWLRRRFPTTTPIGGRPPTDRSQGWNASSSRRRRRTTDALTQGIVPAAVALTPPLRQSGGRRRQRAELRRPAEGGKTLKRATLSVIAVLSRNGMTTRVAFLNDCNQLILPHIHITVMNTVEVLSKRDGRELMYRHSGDGCSRMRLLECGWTVAFYEHMHARMHIKISARGTHARV